MTTTKSNPFTYQAYLVGDLLQRSLESVGLSSDYVMVAGDFDERGTTGIEVSLRVSSSATDGTYLFDSGREEKCEAFLAAFDDASLVRQASYGGRPDMKVQGVTRSGIAWEINFGSGVCERVQVGTKKVEHIDPEVYATLPKVTVDEPIFEYRCPDPIISAGLLA